jgi:hypothetical protein
MTAELRVESIEPFPGWDGYEWVRATAEVAVDPDCDASRRIVDLGRAARGRDGLVTFDADVRVLRPTGGGNGRLLCVVPNRGMLGGVPFSVGAPESPVPEPPHPGDGLLLQQGWTVLWCGWQWNVLDGVGLRAPVVDVGPGWLRVEWRHDVAEAELQLSDSSVFRFADYPTADVDDPDAVLTVRTSPDGERVVLPRDRWRFTDATHIALDGGFEPFRWYELVYRTQLCPVVGAGLLAFRDVAAAVGADFDHTFAFGVSQSGRFLRQLLWEGLNVDDHGRQVFDGMLVHLAGGRRGEFNHRYANPSYTHVIGFSNLPPFSTTELLSRQRELGGVPKLLEVNTAWEYWRGDGALVHLDAVSGDDAPEDPASRVYLLAGQDHLQSPAWKADSPVANPVHTLSAWLVLRALFRALERWVVDDEPPPPSRVPRHADGTAVARDAVLARFGHALRPDPSVLNVTRRLDLGPDADAGIGRWPLRAGEPFVALVADVDEDGNERCGVRVPEVAAPVAAYTGWNPRRPIAGLPDVLYEFVGSCLPFPPGRATVAERYPDEQAYEAAALAAAAALVDEGFALDVDRDRAVAAAVARYRAVTAPNATRDDGALASR